MKTTSHLLAIALLAFFLEGCAKNPADDVAEAEVSDPSASAKPGSVDPATAVRKFTFSPESSIEFIGSKVTGSHNGGFKKFTGHVSIAGETIAPGPHEVIIDMESTWADHPKLQNHLKSADFFDVETYPRATFHLSSLEKADAGADTHNLSGEFTLRGNKKAITFPATIIPEGAGYRLQSEFSINRKDFGLRYPGKPDDLIRDEVVITLDLLAVPGGD